MTGVIDAYSAMKNQNFGRDPNAKYYKESIPRGYSKSKLQQFTPEQLELYKQLFGHLGPDSYTARLAGGDEDLFNEMEAPALRQFNQLQSGIANKYSGQGLGGRRSSGFRNEQTAAGSNFAQELQANRQGLQRQATRDLFEMSQMLMGQRPYETSLAEKGPSNFEKGLNYTIQGAKAASGFYGGK
jgi:hypothetical protein